MIEPETMASVRIIGSRNSIDAVITELHKTGVIEIRDLSAEIKKFEGAIEQDSPLAKFEPVSKQLVKLRGIESILPKTKKTAKIEASEENALEEAEAIDERTPFEWHNELENTKKQLEALKTELETAKKLCAFDTDFSKLESKHLTFFIGTIPARHFEEAKKKLKKIKNAETVARKTPDGETAVIVAVENSQSVEAMQALSAHAFNRITVPQGVNRPQALLAELHAKTHELEKKRIELESKITEYAENNYAKIKSLVKALETQAERAGITTNFVRTKNLFVLEGWVKEKEYHKLKLHLKQAAGESVIVEKVKVKGQAPTSLNNPSMVANFEDLATFVSLPKSNEFDPTMLYAFTFPIIYGMMLGDIAYGAVVLLLGLALWLKASGPIKRFGFVLVPCGVWSIIWGAIFGEALGFEFHAVISRVENVPMLLGLAIATGALHLLLGFTLGFFKEIKHNNTKHAAAKLAWAAVIISIGVLALFSSSQTAMIGAAAMLVASIAVIGWGEGLMGLVEIPGLIGNILSYMRIAAVGLASIALAVILNQFTPDFSMGIIAIPMTILFVGGHAFNIFLGIFEPFVQGSRLHFVEFYMKFYEGGGKPFTPFSVKKSK
ncbi:V-type ATP synthase subunit I [Candidatus Micrarchaeota archaeon]|nr:V-type ATP synthase subunit I [Candidatus Micrarchaeota archaeon]